MSCGLEIARAMSRICRRTAPFPQSRRNGVVSTAALTTPYGLWVNCRGEVATQEAGPLRPTAGPPLQGQPFVAFEP
jgi:hypothetical protein